MRCTKFAQFGSSALLKKNDSKFNCNLKCFFVIEKEKNARFGDFVCKTLYFARTMKQVKTYPLCPYSWFNSDNERFFFGSQLNFRSDQTKPKLFT